MQVYDRVIGQDNPHSLIWLIIGAAVAFLSEFILSIAKTKLILDLSLNQESNLSSKLFNKICSSETLLKNQDEIRLSETISSLSSIRDFTANHLIQAFLDIPFLILYVFCLLYLSEPIGLFSLSLIIFFFLSLIIVNLVGGNFLTKYKAAQLSNNQLLVNQLQNISIIKSCSYEEKSLRNYENTQGESSKLLFKNNFFHSLIKNYTLITSQAILLSITCFGAYLSIQGDISIGVLTAIVIISSRITKPLNNLTFFILKYPQVKHQQKEINKILQIKSEETSTTKLTKYHHGDLILNQVSNEIFKDLSFSFLKNKTYFIPLNKNSKKIDSLLSLIIKDSPLINGNIYFDNININKVSNSSLRQSIYLMSHSTDLYTGTIIDNIKLFDPNNEYLAQICATVVGLDGYASELPKGFSTELTTNKIETLPLNIKYKILFARILYINPKILIINDIDNQMDNPTIKMMMEIISKIKNQMTIIFISHNDLSNQIYDYKINLDENNKLILEYHND